MFGIPIILHKWNRMGNQISDLDESTKPNNVLFSNYCPEFRFRKLGKDQHHHIAHMVYFLQE